MSWYTVIDFQFDAALFDAAGSNVEIFSKIAVADKITLDNIPSFPINKADVYRPLRTAKPVATPYTRRQNKKVKA